MWWCKLLCSYFESHTLEQYFFHHAAHRNQNWDCPLLWAVGRLFVSNDIKGGAGVASQISSNMHFSWSSGSYRENNDWVQKLWSHTKDDVLCPFPNLHFWKGSITSQASSLATDHLLDGRPGIAARSQWADLNFVFLLATVSWFFLSQVHYSLVIFSR